MTGSINHDLCDQPFFKKWKTTTFPDDFGRLDFLLSCTFQQSRSWNNAVSNLLDAFQWFSHLEWSDGYYSTFEFPLAVMRHIPNLERIKKTMIGDFKNKCLLIEQIYLIWMEK